MIIYKEAFINTTGSQDRTGTTACPASDFLSHILLDQLTDNPHVYVQDRGFSRQDQDWEPVWSDHRYLETMGIKSTSRQLNALRSVISRLLKSTELWGEAWAFKSQMQMLWCIMSDQCCIYRWNPDTTVHPFNPWLIYRACNIFLFAISVHHC